MEFLNLLIPVVLCAFTLFWLVAGLKNLSNLHGAIALYQLVLASVAGVSAYWAFHHPIF